MSGSDKNDNADQQDPTVGLGPMWYYVSGLILFLIILGIGVYANIIQSRLPASYETGWLGLVEVWFPVCGGLFAIGFAVLLFGALKAKRTGTLSKEQTSTPQQAPASKQDVSKPATPKHSTPKQQTSSVQPSIVYTSTMSPQLPPPTENAFSRIRKVEEEQAAQVEADRIAHEKAQAERVAREQDEEEPVAPEQPLPAELPQANQKTKKTRARKPQQQLVAKSPTTSSKSPQQALHCPRCNSSYQEGDAFCKKCGLALTALGTKTELATQTMTCPNCAATVPADATFCPKCGSTIFLTGTTEPTVLVDRPLPPRLLRDSSMVNPEAETAAATTTSRICPSCHSTIQPGPEDRFCGNCGHMLV